MDPVETLGWQGPWAMSLCQTHACLTPTTLVKEEVGALLPGALAAAAAEQDWSPVGRGPRQPNAGLHLPAPCLGHQWGPGVGAGSPVVCACSMLVYSFSSRSGPWCGVWFWLQTKKRLRV